MVNTCPVWAQTKQCSDVAAGPTPPELWLQCVCGRLFPECSLCVFQCVRGNMEPCLRAVGVEGFFREHVLKKTSWLYGCFVYSFLK